MACCQNWRLIELTNGNTGPVAVNGLLPLGSITRRVGKTPRCTPTWEIGTTYNNTITISESGIYKISYTGTLVAAEAGDLIVDILQDGNVIASRTITVVEGGSVNAALIKEARVYCNCCNGVLPITFAIRIRGVAITDANGSFIIDGVVI